MRPSRRAGCCVVYVCVVLCLLHVFSPRDPIIICYYHSFYLPRVSVCSLIMVATKSYITLMSSSSIYNIYHDHLVVPQIIKLAFDG
jgi:hypothetical protein